MKRLNLKLLASIAGVSNASIRAGYKNMGPRPVEIKKIELASTVLMEDARGSARVLDMAPEDLLTIDATRIIHTDLAPYERQAYSPIETFAWAFSRYATHDCGLKAGMVCDALKTAHRFGLLHNIVAFFAGIENTSDLDKIFFLTKELPIASQSQLSLEKIPPAFVNATNGITFENMRDWEHLSLVAVKPFWDEFSKKLTEYGLRISVEEQEGFPLSIEFVEISKNAAGNDE